DEAAMLTGSIGMLPSASLGGRTGLYEPVHGSAPDIAGKNLANPLAAIASVALMFQYSFNMKKAAQIIEKAIEEVLLDGYRTSDLASDAHTILGTSEMGDAVAKKICKILG
ncbi:MAG: isocitrate/isopropylmalate family dehydrogenase, partial [candidate division KSB1 bacterium]|nr:isocitrate/isopropylmalate family dehydrogenase [candidate division KSB1 bacterium]